MRPQKIIRGTFYIEQHDTTWVNPIVEIREINIPLPASTIDIAIALKSQDKTSVFHYFVLRGIEVMNLSYEGESNLFERVEDGLEQYLVTPEKITE